MKSLVFLYINNIYDVSLVTPHLLTQL